MPAIRIRAMRTDDIPFGMRLKESAGWNQTEADWRRFIALQPDGIWVAELAGRDVGTTATFIFDTIAWIAMVLTAQAFRGQGIATALMEHALRWLDRDGIDTIRLDATPLGRSVYARLGFVAEGEVVRYEGTSRQVTPATPVTRLTGPDGLPGIAQLDQEATGTNRRRLLELMCAEAEVTTLGIRVDGELSGYAMVRPGTRAVQIGPCIALDELSAISLLNAAAAHASGAPTFIDIPLGNRPACRWAETAGLSVQRTFTRMKRGKPVRENLERLWAGSGPEKG
ncbi:MAG: hypothetical protein AUJ92_02810 [Armatimonadetes bacterium CG2_30_59_28]|nr:GNAT family N-acetyltransferase [Armatimonadota bacterium]OIO97844.1 MAG: hypothetical protein AUJ92_02810 [Armatimonadetes bacterium CG2_30_59_28]PIU65249.1 MAG: GNAT family N-acetyltransferase [Armatimonadetes bacterium CG07_land_8_20_14_0_80_59_28]PIY41760.1 MAG: GNAT family N-acetyltransferase [Armatimonadetes bacterium CG_4_10_14_3_um_filter_59_10]PJB71482.1 MAG: GNAT family N-acetyltransferase [Armatimonadetes bacterium CG_4_9_14_3_um_filter_58_7]